MIAIIIIVIVVISFLGSAGLTPPVPWNFKCNNISLSYKQWW